MRFPRGTARQPAAQPGGPACRLRRGGAGTGFEGPCSQDHAAGSGGARPSRRATVGSGRRRLRRRPRPHGRAPGGRRLWPLLGLEPWQARHRRASHGGASARAADGGRPAAAALRRLAGVRRPHPTGEGGRHRGLRDARRILGRRRGRGLRQGRQNVGPRLSRRPSGRRLRRGRGR